MQSGSDVERIMDVSISGPVADDVVSPVKQPEPWDEEDECSKHICSKNPGADDSEEEMDNDLARAMFEADKTNVPVDWTDHLQSMQEEKCNLPSSRE